MYINNIYTVWPISSTVQTEGPLNSYDWLQYSLGLSGESSRADAEATRSTILHEDDYSDSEMFDRQNSAEKVNYPACSPEKDKCQACSPEVVNYPVCSLEKVEYRACLPEKVIDKVFSQEKVIYRACILLGICYMYIKCPVHIEVFIPVQLL